MDIWMCAFDVQHSTGQSPRVWRAPEGRPVQRTSSATKYRPRWRKECRPADDGPVRSGDEHLPNRPSKAVISVAAAQSCSVVMQRTLEMLSKCFYQATPLWPLRAELSRDGALLKRPQQRIFSTRVITEVTLCPALTEALLLEAREPPHTEREETTFRFCSQKCSLPLAHCSDTQVTQECAARSR
eukprot:s723_g1.t1